MRELSAPAWAEVRAQRRERRRPGGGFGHGHPTALIAHYTTSQGAGYEWTREVSLADAARARPALGGHGARLVWQNRHMA